MHRLPKYIEALRALAVSPEGNRLLLAEKQVNEFVQTEAADPQSSLKHLRDALSDEIEKKPNESSFGLACRAT